MLNAIQRVLETVEDREHIFYGGVTNVDPVDRWNYIVFSRGPLRRSAKGNTSYVRTITVAIVHEEYVPEETIHAVIDAMESLPNVRFEDIGSSSDYDYKGNTKTVVEVASLQFSWAYKKGVNNG